MDFSELLKPEAVRVLNSATSKKRLMQDISDLYEHAYGLETDVVLEALLAREALGPTGVGHGIALPHARLADLDRVVGTFVLLDKPMISDRLTGNPSILHSRCLLLKMQALTI